MCSNIYQRQLLQCSEISKILQTHYNMNIFLLETLNKGFHQKRGAHTSQGSIHNALPAALCPPVPALSLCITLKGFISEKKV